jgi:hypothetical protein
MSTIAYLGGSMKQQIDRSIRSRKSFILMFALVIAASQLTMGCTPASNYTRHLNTVGNCNLPTKIEIIDETNGKDMDRKPRDILKDRHFQNYVNTISKYIFDKIDKIGQCQSNPAANPQVKLVFVYRPAISRGITPFDDYFDRQKSPDTKRLDSPWAKLTVRKSPKLTMRGVFVWNERQFLLDQAMIFGEKVSDIKPLLPIDPEIFDRWERNYDTNLAESKINRTKELPVDIWWLFRWRRTRTILSGETKTDTGTQFLNNIINEEKIGHADFTKEIINRLFALENTEIRYNSVLELKDIFKIEKNKMYPFTEKWLIDEIKLLL